jgi:tetratricopeptide (TPR) repeat protein
MSISRNAPCKCGSGKKYKKCCLGKEDIIPISKDNELKKENISNSNLSYSFIDCEVDDLSNSVFDLIKSKEFDKAKDICQKLQDEYPDQVDGIERLAAVYEAEGNVEKAADYYRKTVDFMKANPGFDDEGIKWYTDKAKKLESKGN